MLDRLTTASVRGRMASVEISHREARAVVVGFCAAHGKLVDAAASDKLDDEETYGEIVSAVRTAAPLPVPKSSTSDDKGDEEEKK